MRFGSASHVRFGTTSENVAVTGFFTVALVAETVTAYTPGFVALPETMPVLASYLTPAGSPFTVSFGVESDSTSPSRSSANDPSASASYNSSIKYAISSGL